MKATVATGAKNLRGSRVWFVIDGYVIEGTVITHTRNDRWVIDAPRLLRLTGSRRISLQRRKFQLTPFERYAVETAKA